MFKNWKVPKLFQNITPFKVIYIIIVTISALIVAGYLIVTFAIRPPTVGQTEAPPVPAVNDTGGSSSTSNGNDATKATVERPSHRLQREQVYTCLIFGLDDGNGCTDTIMVATFDVPNQKIGLVSIPRDTVIRLDQSAGMNKVNTAYSSGGVDQLKDEVEELLGIPLNFYVKIQLDAFEKLVDAVGGVYFDVPFNMQYSDPTQNLYINQAAGYRLLSGEDAMEVVRFRQSNTDSSFSDVGRVGVQQAFLKAMLSQVMSGASLDSVPELVDILLNYVETDANLNDMLYFARSLVGMDIESAVTTSMLPSTWHNPYMWVNEKEALNVINELLNPYPDEITSDMVEFYKR